MIKDFDKPYAFKNGYNRVSYLVTLEYPGKDRLAPSILVFRVLSVSLGLFIGAYHRGNA